MFKPVALSWMGMFGSFSAKPSYGWGTPSVAQIAAWAIARMLSPSLVVRKWIPNLYAKLTAQRRKMLKLCSKGVTKKSVNKRTGKVQVPWPQTQTCNNT